jgi:hypothetical protein
MKVMKWLKKTKEKRKIASGGVIMKITVMAGRNGRPM